MLHQLFNFAIEKLAQAINGVGAGTVIDFTYQGVRCREQTALSDSPLNRKRVEVVAEKINKARRDGTFTYRTFFPNSSMADRFEGAGSSRL
jgi:integrase